MNIVIIEDEKPAARRLSKLITEIKPDVNIIVVLESVAQSIEWFKSNPCPDLIFSDIQLSDDLSFEIYKQINIESPIIFTTAFDEYAIQAFEHFSIDYLLKPIRREKLEKAISKLDLFQQKTTAIDAHAILKTLEQKKFRTRFLVYSGENLLSIPEDKIAYFYSEDGVTFLRTKENKKYIINDTLDKLESEVDNKRFFRANRKFIVSIESVHNASLFFKQKLKIILKPEAEEEVIVSKLKATAFKNWMNN